MYTLGRFASSGAPTTIDTATRRLHINLIGATGTGKSSLLKTMMQDDLAAGRGFALVDPHGDLAHDIADAVPKERIADTIYIDPLDPTHAVGFNPLSARSDPAILTAHIVSCFKHIWKDSWGPRLEHILTNAIRVIVCSRNPSLIHLPLFLAREKYREELLKRCDDPIVRMFWTEQFPSYSERIRADALAPVDNKVGQFTSNPYLRAIIGQDATFDLSHVINNERILVANLSKRIGDDPAHLLGAFLVTAIAQAAQGRASIPEKERKDFTLYVDEFQNFATETFVSILSEMRKWRLNLVLASQFTHQVPEIIRQAVFGNVGTMVVFRVGAEDAPILAEQLDLPNPSQLGSTRNYAAWVKTLSDGAPTEPRLISTLPPRRTSAGSFDRVVARTRARYCRRREDVERPIEELFKSRPRRKPRPRW